MGDATGFGLIVECQRRARRAGGRCISSPPTRAPVVCCAGPGCIRCSSVPDARSPTSPPSPAPPADRPRRIRHRGHPAAGLPVLWALSPCWSLSRLAAPRLAFDACPRAPMPPGPSATARGSCARMPATPAPRRPTRCTAATSPRARPGSRSRSTCRPRPATTPTTPGPGRGRQGRRPDLAPRRHAGAVRRHPAARDEHLDDDQRHRHVAAGALPGAPRRSRPRRPVRTRHQRCAPWRGPRRTTSSRSTCRAGPTSSRRGPRCG